MAKLTELQVDMRNTHEMLKMGNLKKKLDNMSFENRNERSKIVSKKYSSPSAIKQEEEEKTIKLKIVM